MRKICVTISARASYSRVSCLLDEIEKSKKLELFIVLIGSSIIDKYGNIYEELSMKYKNVHRIHTSLEASDLSSMAKTTGLSIIELSSFYNYHKPEIVITIADRFETISSSIAASYQNIPLAHIQGGEITGNIDEKVRHANTKLSDYHFVSNEKAYQRVLRLGENPQYIFNTGCPSLDLANKIKLNDSNNFNPFEKNAGVGKKFNLINKGYLVLLQHPDTNSYGDVKKQIITSLQAIEKFGMPAFIFWPNMDLGTDLLSKELRRFREKNNEKNFYYIKNLKPNDFLNLISKSYCLIGNSSCGIRECSFLGVPVVNIGNRQNGRLKGPNVINVKHDSKEILNAIQKCRNLNPQKVEIYGDGNSGLKIASILEKIQLISEKKFHE